MSPEERAQALDRLLQEAGFGAAAREPLAGDASTRRYERLILADRRAILMDAPRSAESPPCPPEASEEERLRLGWNATSRLAASRVEAFVAAAAYLKGLGLSAPEILGADLEAGYAVVEDLGEALIARVAADGGDEVALYAAAGDAMGAVQTAAPPAQLEGHGAAWPLLDYDALALRVNADLFTEWLPRLAPDIRFSDADRARFEALRSDLIARALAFPRVMTLRDYHAENLIWLPEREGPARVGLLDFQDALRGWSGWDYMMLVQDARRDISPAAEDAAARALLERTGGSRAYLEEEAAILGALNSFRLLGLFSRLVARDGKPRYASFMPRVWRTLDRNLDHPALRDARGFVEAVAGPYLRSAA